MKRTAQIGPDLWRIRADNPSPLTGTGTNSYLLQAADGAILIDAGPDLPAHRQAILSALNGARLQAIFITHPHQDHSAAAPWLAAQTGAKIYSFGPAPCRDGQEGADLRHHPDIALADGARVTIAGFDISAIHTPGHMHPHLCFGYRDMLFSGDHVMGWATSLVAPPDGDMATYRASLRKLQGLGYARYLPGHGEDITDPESRLAYLIDHRAKREAQILAALAQGPSDPQSIAALIYTDIPPALLPAAAQNVLAHLIELTRLGRVKGDAARARYSLD